MGPPGRRGDRRCLDVPRDAGGDLVSGVSAERRTRRHETLADPGQPQPQRSMISTAIGGERLLAEPRQAFDLESLDREANGRRKLDFIRNREDVDQTRGRDPAEIEAGYVPRREGDRQLAGAPSGRDRLAKVAIVLSGVVA